MTPRERLEAVLRGRKPDRVPWFGDLDYWATALEAQGRKPKGFKRSSAYLDWHRELGVGFYLQGYFPFRAIVEECEVTERRDGPLRTRRVVTPRGELEERWRTLESSFSEAPLERLVKSPRDLGALEWLYAHTRYEPDYGFAIERASQVGELGIALVYLPRSPFMQLVAVEAGIEAVVACAADAPLELERALSAMRRSHDAAAGIALDCPADAAMIPENLSSEVVGKRFFHDHVEDYQRYWVRRIREAGKVSFVHMDGSLRGLLAEEADVGFDVLEALTPSPVGDLGVSEWHRVARGSSSVFWGGLPGSYFTAHVSVEELERHLREVLEVMTGSPRYVLGVADQVPPDALASRVVRVGELVERYGRYH